MLYWVLKISLLIGVLLLCFLLLGLLFGGFCILLVIRMLLLMVMVMGNSALVGLVMGFGLFVVWLVFVLLSLFGGWLGEVGRGGGLWFDLTFPLGLGLGLAYHLG